MGDNYNTSTGKPNKPDNLLVWSILSTIFCCVPLGVVAIIHSSKVDGLWAEGRYAEAEEEAKKAKKFMLIGVGLFLAFLIVYVVLIIAGVATGIFAGIFE